MKKGDEHITDTYRTFHTTPAECIFSSVHRTFSKIGPTLEHQASPDLSPNLGLKWYQASLLTSNCMKLEIN